MNIGIFYYLILFIICIYTILFFVISWFFPSLLLKYIHKQRENNQKVFPIIPNGFWDFIYLNNNETANIWFARFVSLIGLGIIVFAVVMYSQNRVFEIY
jgi:hypothetical protein